MTDKTGGAAFPSPGVVLHSGTREQQQGAYEGMSLRDYFAAKTMQGLLSVLANPAGAEAVLCRATQLGVDVETLLSSDSYKVADAMLAERAK